MQSDEELMVAAARGDLGAFEQLVVRYQQTAWTIACRYLGDRSEAEDVAQEAFLKILKAAPRYRPSAAFRTHLIRVTSRLCIDRGRKMHPVDGFGARLARRRQNCRPGCGSNRTGQGYPKRSGRAAVVSANGSRSSVL